MSNPNLTVCGRPSVLDYSQYTYVSVDPPTFQSFMMGDPNYGLVSTDRMKCSDFNSPPYQQPIIPNGSKAVNALGLAPGWYYGREDECSQSSPPMTCYFTTNPPKGCTYPYYPGACFFANTEGVVGPSDDPLICSSDWSGVMSQENIVGCCSGMETSSGVCHPMFCPVSETCAAPMQNACTPDAWSSSFNTQCNQYANLAPPSYAKPLILSAVQQFYASNAPSDDDPFVPISIEMCSKYPGLCDPILSKVCSPYTSEDLNPSNWIGRTNDPDGTNLMKVCGCFLPSNQYVFANGLQGPAGIACNSICSFPGTVPIFNQTTGSAAQCKATVCALNDVVVDVTNSTLNSVTLNQVCGQCNSSNPCICYFNDVEVSDITDPSLQLQISSNCQTCFNYDSATGTSTQVPCPGGGATGGIISNITTFVSNNKKLVIITCIAVIILILICIFWIAAKNRNGKGASPKQKT